MKPFENNDFTYSWKWWDPKQPTGLYPIMHWDEGRRHLEKMPVHYKSINDEFAVTPHFTPFVSAFEERDPPLCLDRGKILMLPTCKLHRRGRISPAARCRWLCFYFHTRISRLHVDFVQSTRTPPVFNWYRLRAVIVKRNWHTHRSQLYLWEIQTIRINKIHKPYKIHIYPFIRGVVCNVKTA